MWGRPYRESGLRAGLPRALLVSYIDREAGSRGGQTRRLPLRDPGLAEGRPGDPARPSSGPRGPQYKQTPTILGAQTLAPKSGGSCWWWCGSTSRTLVLQARTRMAPSCLKGKKAFTWYNSSPSPPPYHSRLLTDEAPGPLTPQGAGSPKNA